MDGIISQLQDLKTQIDELMSRINIDDKAQRAAELEHQASAVDFWDTPSEAQKIMQQLSKLNSQVQKWRGDGADCVVNGRYLPSAWRGCISRKLAPQHQ